MEEKEKELAVKLQEVDDQLNQQTLIDELKESYEAKLQSAEQEQLIIAQVSFPRTLCGLTLVGLLSHVRKNGEVGKTRRVRIAFYQ